MTERLQQIHHMLRVGNVPCALESRPGLGVVLLAGAPDSHGWDVLVRDTGRQLSIHGSRGVTELPAGSADAAIADAVKWHVVQAWADQGDPEAQALIAKVHQSRGPLYEPIPDPRHEYASTGAIATFFDPLQFAEQMIGAAIRLGSLFLAPLPGPTTFTFQSPWVTMYSGYTRRWSDMRSRQQAEWP